VAGKQLEQPPGPPTPTASADNLMEALRRSVEEAKNNRGGTAPATGPPRKRAAKPTTTKHTATKSVGTAQPATAKKSTAAKKNAAKNGATQRSTKNR
jgi:hypothetical protein